MTLWRQGVGEGVPGHASADSLRARIAVSGWVAWFSLGKAVVPVGLALLYPRWRRPVAMGLGCCLLSLGPVLGIVPMWFRLTRGGRVALRGASAAEPRH